ncbi:hypothetical protein H310_12697 [Aphanomyces invadans]|uniref:Thioredoxin-like fold domain-containing protein n=1 Tax=Aphanomyces invadans TaxID=157072 RepID=A0A024TIS8_9STRA|nr:hypothetical protein H310_12697 [Aphanomyces invadans]ETV93262.1 hypothetical protein H310_12697 [Aphanomyces invadans]|eukprot:XP_008878097.1 hypothetical protein H310_12697 [Aphanomyces invadans]
MGFFRSLLVVFAMGVSSSVGDTPTTTPGFAFKDGLAQAPVQLQAFIDLLCPYSKAAYPALKKLGDAFDGSDFRLTFQVLPLPFHRNAFLAAQSAVSVVQAVGPHSFVPWLETIYANQDTLSNANTLDTTPSTLINQLATWAHAAFPSIKIDAFRETMQPGTTTDEKTRQLFRYTLAHGIAGTPMFFLNGVHFNDADSAWTFDDWYKVINPLVQANKAAAPHSNVMSIHVALPDRTVHLNAPPSVCGSDHVACGIADGKTVCCSLASEVCIVRRGCMQHEALAALVQQ